MTMTDPYDTGMRFTTHERPGADGRGAGFELAAYVSGHQKAYPYPHATVRANRAIRPDEADLRWASVHWTATGQVEAERLTKDNGEVFYVVRQPDNRSLQLFIDEDTALAIHHAVAAAIADVEAAS